jgi:4-hydroxy-tetrahydrodipicolinate synthase
MCQLCLDNNFAPAIEMQLKYLEVINNLFIEVNPIPVKAAMNMMGMPSGTMRMPLVEMGEANAEKLRASIQRLGLVD